MHEFLPGQCAICLEGQASKANARVGTSRRPTSAAMSRFIKALRAQAASHGKPRRERKRLAEQARLVGLSLTPSERQRARKIVDADLREAAERRRARLEEDRLAGIYRPRVMVENVGRGKRS